MVAGSLPRDRTPVLGTDGPPKPLPGTPTALPLDTCLDEEATVHHVRCRPLPSAAVPLARWTENGHGPPMSEPQASLNFPTGGV